MRTPTTRETLARERPSQLHDDAHVRVKCFFFAPSSCQGRESLWWLESSYGLSRWPLNARFYDVVNHVIDFCWEFTVLLQLDFRRRFYWNSINFFDMRLIFVLWPSFFRSVMSMAVHQATQMEERVWLPPIWDLAWSAQ